MKYISINLIVFSTMLILLFAFFLFPIDRNGILEKIINPLTPVKRQEKKKALQVTSIDTMKYSRDLSNQMAGNLSFDTVIDQQVNAIAKTGATHIAIGTPYDEQFLPVLNRWVKAARYYHLHVWFRGNFSGWEKWFGYQGIDRQTHIAMTKNFILSNKTLFENGDIFSSCPECENGGPGDPRTTGDVASYRAFLVDEYRVASDSFHTLGKNVSANYDSMNADVARLIMDKETTKKLGGIVVIDHYVATPDELTMGVTQIAQNSGGKIVLGEFGAPVPDISGTMSEKEQAAWIQSSIEKLMYVKQFVGMNYWVNVGGSTAIFNDDGTPKEAVSVITDAFMKNRNKLL